MIAPTPTTSIKIPAGTIVGTLANSATKGKLTGGTVKLLADVYVDATRGEDGAWLYSDGKTCYVCAGGLATVVTAPEEEVNPGPWVDLDGIYFEVAGQTFGPFEDEDAAEEAFDVELRKVKRAAA